MLRNSSIGISGLLICVAIIGCGGGPNDKPIVGLVKGTVTLDGKPVSGAIVEFNPDNTRSTTGPKSSGRTDASGNYELVGPGNIAGAVVGFHKITVACPPPMAESSSPDGKAAQESGEPCKLPAKFGALSSTDVSKEVMPGKNDLAIELKSE